MPSRPMPGAGPAYYDTVVKYNHSECHLYNAAVFTLRPGESPEFKAPDLGHYVQPSAAVDTQRSDSPLNDRQQSIR